MMNGFLLAFALAGTPPTVVATPTAQPAGISDAAEQTSSEAVATPFSDKDAALRFVKRLVESDKYQALDPSFVLADSFASRTFRFGATYIVRIQLQKSGLDIIGADRVFRLTSSSDYRVQLESDLDGFPDFLLSDAEAFNIAMSTGRPSPLPKSAFRDFAALARPVWWAARGEVRPAFRVRIPTLSPVEAEAIIVDAVNGSIIGRRPLAFFQAAPNQAHAFTWGPAGDPNTEPTSDVELQDLIDAPVGENLLGGYFQTANCCQLYVCADGSDVCDFNDPEAALCADDVEPPPPDAKEASIDVPVDADFIPIPIGVDTFYVRASLCAELPKVRSTVADGNRPDGWFPSPIDIAPGATPSPDSIASDSDDFAEVQAYHGSSSFFHHVRDVMEDQTFCLGGNSMQCNEDGTPATNVFGRPTRPLRVAVNATLPDIDIPKLGEAFLTGGGAGTEPANPLLIGKARFSNAAFLPAGNIGDLISLPEQFSGLLTSLDRDFDSVLLFQGQTHDFAYDGSILFHELTHAITYSLIPGLNQITVGEYGASADPGALHEAYADFFSASFREDPVIGNYAGQNASDPEAVIRTVDNSATCPGDIIGEVHHDSAVLSGALWELRQATSAENIPLLEKVLWTNLAQAGDNESFETHIARLTTELEEQIGPSDAAAIFAARGLDQCVRVVALRTATESDDPEVIPTFVDSAKERLEIPELLTVGLNDYVPAPVQFTVDVLARTTDSIRFDWDQALVPRFDTGLAPDPVSLNVFVTESDAPVSFSENNGELFPSSDVGSLAWAPNPIFEANDTNPERPFFVYNTLEFDDDNPCAVRRYHVVFANPSDTRVALSNIRAEVISNDAETPSDCSVVEMSDAGIDDVDDDVDLSTDVDETCSCAQADAKRPLAAGVFLLGILGFTARRRRN